MTCSRLATTLDEEMLVAFGLTIAPRHTPDGALPRRPGPDVARELGGRLLVRYLTPAQLGDFTGGSVGRLHYTSPTAYTATEAVPWLALPAPSVPREYALLLDPGQIDEIQGPRYVRWGGGIEYLLPEGFPRHALHVPWEVVVT